MVDARIFSYLWERLGIFIESIRSTGSKRDAHSQFSSEGFFQGSLQGVTSVVEQLLINGNEGR